MGDTYTVPDLNPYFASACDATYGGGTWPTPPVSGGFSGQMYSAPNLAILAPIAPSVFVTPTTSVTQYVSFSETFTATVDGQAPVTLQWYKSPGTVLTNQTGLTLNLTNLSVGDSGSYYAVVTNSSGSVTSSVVNLTVQTVGFINQLPTAYTNVITLFAGANPTFSVSAGGAAPLYYFWFTNGVLVGGATNTSYTLTNAQALSPTNFNCIISNVFGTATSIVWTVSVIPDPTAPYPQTVLSAHPIGYWRLNEGPDDGNGDQGVIADDCLGGNNGIYTNVGLAQTGYNATDPDRAGKFSEADYEETKQALDMEAARVLAEMDQLTGGISDSRHAPGGYRKAPFMIALSSTGARACLGCRCGVCATFFEGCAQAYIA